MTRVQQCGPASCAFDRLHLVTLTGRIPPCVPVAATAQRRSVRRLRFVDVGGAPGMGGGGV
jgi:hypothetical protein